MTISRLSSHTGVLLFCFLGKYVAAGSSTNGMVFVWDVSSGKLKGKLEGHEGSVCGLAWGTGGFSGQQVASVDKNGTLIFWV
mgnify:CR=1 FL=1